MSGLLAFREVYKPRFRVVARVGKCACSSTIALMAALGMPNAAKMHDPAMKGVAWQPDTLKLHMGEEERSLFKILMFIGTRDGDSELLRRVTALQAEHDGWRTGVLEANKMPPKRELDVHGAEEDRLVERYRLKILAIAGNKQLRVRAGIGGRVSRSLRALIGEIVLDSKMVPLYLTDADRMRAITTSADAYYRASPAKGDASKLGLLSSNYPEKAKAAEADADRKFAEAWVGTKDGAQRIAVEIGGAAALLVIAYPLAIMAVAGYVSWEAAKKLWSWIGGGGHGFDQEWVDRAKAHVAEMLTYGVVPKAFYEAGDVSPMGYAKDLAMNLNVVKNLDAYAAPGALDEFQNVTASVWRYAGSDPVIREDIGKITKSINGWPLAWAEKTTSTYDSASTSRDLVEAIGLAAAHDDGAPVYIWKTAIDAAAVGWDQGMDVAKGKTLPRKIIFDGADFEDGTGDAPGVIGGGALAAIYAYRAARKAVREAMGLSVDSGSGAPDRRLMPTPTIDNPTPGRGGSWTPWLLGAGATVALGGLAIVSWPVAAAVGVGTWIVTRLAG